MSQGREESTDGEEIQAVMTQGQCKPKKVRERETKGWGVFNPRASNLLVAKPSLKTERRGLNIKAKF